LREDCGVWWELSLKIGLDASSGCRGRIWYIVSFGKFQKSTNRRNFLKISKMFTNRSIFENFDIFLNKRIGVIKIRHTLFPNTFSAPQKKINTHII
jgi:hypothetical protein